MAETLDLDQARHLPCTLEDHVRETVIEAGTENSQQELVEVAAAVRPAPCHMLERHLGSLP